MIKLLIDECLSPELALVARERGHLEASHVSWIGKSGWKDWQIKQVVLNEDWTLVTRNSNDFRGPAEAPGSRGQFVDVSLHAGLICLNGSAGFDLMMQRELFSVALAELEEIQDLINQVLEVTLDEEQNAIQVSRYSLPVIGRGA